MDNPLTARHLLPCDPAFDLVIPPAALNFLSDIATFSPAEHPDVLLLRASYHPQHFCESLFNDFDLSLPAHLHKAVKKRRAEYLASRVCARFALSLMGIDNFVLSNDVTRAPVWPLGIIGSLSHTQHRVCLLLAQATCRKLLGVDCEQLISSNTADDIQKMIISEKEKAVLQRSGLPFTHALTIAFSIKESLYKAIFPSLREFMDFTSAEIVDCAPAASTIVLRLTRHFSTDFPAGRLFRGHVQFQQDEVLSWVVTPWA
ncbi:4'-phosphopantetheinyl transferase superfamily protein [Erwinia endophytica]|uniref:4'-phosphopantetheinyl transferase family protein n=1 Tax=Erwinia endophytica TaxID=1563158 RepID=UPI001265FBED|nr:4'-phosphopantetheinyl transferase superfamily protein [Erwinia endophytica]KAB8312254.1 4'-phosphopantetheinyl transferase superfamily protein [Erwinia endophytica]